MLSICVPTWNRASWLKRCLLAIAAQSKCIAYELRVTDNASTDDTQAIFRELAEGMTNWHYRRNPENYGGIANIRLCTEEAKGDYLLILGDDDLLLPDAFLRLKTALEFAREVEAGAILAHNLRGLPSCSVLPTGFEWLKSAFVGVAAFISSVVWRTETWRDFEYAYNPTSVYTLPHLWLFLDICLRHKVVACNRLLVEIGHADPERGVREDEHGLYSRWPLMDCFEYPEMYRYIVESQKLDLPTWVMVQARRFAHLRHIPRKLLILQHNHSFFDPFITSLPVQIWKSHDRTPYLFPVHWLAVLLSRTKIGRGFADYYCGTVLGHRTLQVDEGQI